jgi:protein-tyrosine phosphatase
MRILFVCLGNICRSPMAEAVMRHHIRARGLEEKVTVDSAGTGDWHAGECADPRTISTLRRHGIACEGAARQLRTNDFQDFDLILAMDSSNLRDIRNWLGADPAKVRLFVPQGVGDPYYGGPEGFEHMFHLIDDECRRILDEIQAGA